MYKFVKRFKGSCPKHPRYNPAVHGRGGIKGGCGVCLDLLLLNEAALELDRRIRYTTKAVAARQLYCGL